MAYALQTNAVDVFYTRALRTKEACRDVRFRRAHRAAMRDRRAQALFVDAGRKHGILSSRGIVVIAAHRVLRLPSKASAATEVKSAKRSVCEEATRVINALR